MRMPRASARIAAGRRRHHRRHGQHRLGGARGAAAIASAAGVSRCPTKAAAPGSAARWCAACCGRMTAVRPGPACCAVCSRIRLRPARHRALDGLGQAARLCSAGAARGRACGARRRGGSRADAAGRGPYRRHRRAARRASAWRGWRLAGGLASSIEPWLGRDDTARTWCRPRPMRSQVLCSSRGQRPESRGRRRADRKRHCDHGERSA